jgi:hypothetical protein
MLLSEALRFSNFYVDAPRQKTTLTVQIEAINQQKKLDGLLNKFAAEAAATESDANLSESGKKNKLYDLQAKKVIPEINDFLRNSQAVFHKTVGLWNGLLKSLEKFAIDKTDIAGALARREIREHFLRQKEGYERSKLFNDQIGKGNLLAYQAVRELNDFFGIVSGKDLADAEMVLMVKSDPQAALNYFDAVHGIVTLQTGLNSLQARLGPFIKGLNLKVGNLEVLPDLELPGMNAEKTEAALVAAVEQAGKQ